MRRAVVALAMLLLPAALAAQSRPRVGASLSAPAVRAGEEVTLEILVQTSGAAPTAIETPRLPDGLNISGTNEFSQFSFSIPGGRQRTIRRQLTLVTSRAGDFRIPPVAVRIDGAVYRTPALSLRVVGGAVAAAPGRSLPPAGAPTALSGGPGDEVLLQSWLAPDTAYVGEQVTLRADALISEDVRSRLAAAPQYQAPSAAGFWTYDLQSRDPLDFRTVRGRLFEVQTFRRAFFPLTPGRYRIPGAGLTYAVRRGFLGGAESRELRSDSLSVVVRPLPVEGRPASFNGAVGSYAVKAHLEPDAVARGEATSLVLEVTGTGNIKELAPPRLAPMPGVEVYPPSEDAQLNPDGPVVGGSKRFVWVLVPRSGGRVRVPPIEIGFFDPAHRQYSVARSDPLELRVGGARAPVAAGARAPTGLQPLRTRPAGGGRLDWLRSPAFAAAMATPLAAVLAALLLRRRRGRRRPVARPGPGAAEALAALRARAADAADAAFFADLEQLGRAQLAERLDAPALRAAPVAALASALRAAGMDDARADSIAALMGRIVEARYVPAPPGPAQRLELVDALGAALQALDAGASGRRRSSAVAGLVLLASLVAPKPAAARAPGPRGGEFRAGVEAYAAGRYGDAVARFAAVVRANPEDATAWYDLGNAFYRTGARGDAIWAWLRALRLEPRADDVRRNLGVAAADPAVVEAASPAVPLSGDEVLLLGAALWVVGGLVLAGALAGRRRPLRLAGAASVVVALAVLGIGGFVRYGPATAIVRPKEASLLAAPNLHADRLAALAEGGAVTVVEERGEWLRVRSADGTEGWIETRAVGRL
ncbi:MAG TPA: BatD family protein [Longimicrobiales bacterium]|nr:BatD family protein [Longimicrobiales bacterium]